MTVVEVCQHMTGAGLQRRTAGIEPGGWLRAWRRWVRQSARLFFDLDEGTEFEKSVAAEVGRLTEVRMEAEEGARWEDGSTA